MMPSISRYGVRALLACALAAPVPALGQALAPARTSAPTKILVHVTSGPENPTRAALAMLVAKTAVDEGHAVTIFLAGDAVQLVRDGVLDNLTGLGTGRLRDHYDALVKAGVRIYVSGMSSAARSVGTGDLQGKPMELSPPSVLIRLLVEHERVLTY